MVEDHYQRIVGFEKDFSEFILDPLHGTIGLTEDEIDLTKTRIFTRLKKIKQLGLVSEFYHGATHTRYEHSLGTLHVTWMVFKRFVDNIKRYKTWIPEEIVKHFSDDTIRALRFTALLHDLGHGPFSHLLEDVSEYLGKRIDHDMITQFLIARDENQRRISPQIWTALSRNQKLKRKFFNLQKELLNILETCHPLQPEKILCIMNPKYRPSFKEREFQTVRNFLHDLIYGDMGSDRIDYLLRDTYYTGLGHRFNLSDLLDNIAAIYDGINGILRFALDVEGRDISDFLLTTRYYHYRLIAHNLKNIDMLARLKKRVEKGRRKNGKELLDVLLDLILEDETYFERKVPALGKWAFQRVGAWSLGQIRTAFYRFIVYRFLIDEQLRPHYLEAIKKRLCWGIEKFSCSSLDESDIHIEYVLEKPHIPIISVYRERYVEDKIFSDGRTEQDKMSALLHDSSAMVLGLARAYLSDVGLVIYTNENHVEKVGNHTSKTIDFFVSPILFTSVLKRLNLRKMNRLDIMLACLHYIHRNSLEVDSMNKLFRVLRYIQRELRLSPGGYKFGGKEGYDPQGKKVFDYPQTVINDLYLFDFSKIIRISKVNRNIRKTGAPMYVDCYNLEIPPPSRKRTTLEVVLSYYPEKYRRKLIAIP